ncbi:MAG TPA: hypothetical protein VK858_05380 [Longimicrobiales bacterium]|nr:hypothetical protein [Longimicrobiales bacterium]
MNRPQRRTRRRIQARRSVVIRDFAIFQLKLLLDAAKDGVLAALSVGALVLDLLSGGGRKPRLFYSVLAMSERFDLWLNLSGAVSRLESEELDDDGLFGASEAGSDSLLGRIEELVRGGDEPGSRKRKPGDEPGAGRKEPGEEPGAQKHARPEEPPPPRG